MEVLSLLMTRQMESLNFPYIECFSDMDLVIDLLSVAAQRQLVGHN